MMIFLIYFDVAVRFAAIIDVLGKGGTVAEFEFAVFAVVAAICNCTMWPYYSCLR